jgi:hypothetical protein
MSNTGPHYWTQTLKWLDAGGNARARMQRLSADQPWATWDASDGDGNQSWYYQEFECPNIVEGLVSGQVSLNFPNTPTVRNLVLQALAEQWLVDVRHYRVTSAALLLYGSFLGAVRSGSATLSTLSISAECSPPPVVATIPPRMATTELIGTPCRLEF